MGEITLNDLIKNSPVDSVIGDNLTIAWKKINNSLYDKIVCSVSGGADSDVMIDICTKCDKDNKIDYVWFDTGLEYQATKDHLKYLEDKYNIKIRIEKAIKPIPMSCKEYGQPFISKNVSEMISRLQRYNFQWGDKPFDELLKEYCVWNEKKQDYIGCKSALEWWCNKKKSDKLGITQNKWLKEFLIAFPPKYQISNKCCEGAKKKVAHKVIKEGKYDLEITGIRKAEGGTRAINYKSCFDEDDSACDRYRPLFWYKGENKEKYKTHYGVVHSKCYTEYGLKRTGCVGCPFGRDFEYELEVIRKYEPKLFTAVNNIFGKSYEYTRKYKEFCKMMNETKKKG